MPSCSVSVIVPVFNAGDYLNRCVRSILAQQLSDFELILVNDGSTDSSLSIIQSFAESDARIVVVDGPNEGVSAARNKGINIATGEYISFVDADDWVAPGFLSTMFRKASEFDADLVITNVLIAADGQEPIKRLKLSEGIVDLGNHREEKIRELMRFKYDFSNWNKLYRTSSIKSGKLQFHVGLKLWEDLLFNLCFLQTASIMYVDDVSLYHYFVHPASAMNQASHDFLREYNMLFESFEAFCHERGYLSAFNVFKVELRRNCYYSILPLILRHVRKRTTGFVSSVREYKMELQKLNPAIIAFDQAELRGTAAIKKWLLTRNYLNTFSIVMNLQYSKVYLNVFRA